VKDIHEWLAHIGIRPPKNPSPSPLAGERAGVRGEFSVTYHESCHLSHGQKITSQPRDLLRAIPGVKLVELPEANWCCGSAGIYNLIQPEMANDLLRRKMKHIRSTGCEVVATGNPGCLLQIMNGAKTEGLNLRVVHPVTLLAEAYRRS
jgi:glycolate oxidase iron-sulfur subunit